MSEVFCGDFSSIRRRTSSNCPLSVFMDYPIIIFTNLILDKKLHRCGFFTTKVIYLHLALIKRFRALTRADIIYPLSRVLLDTFS